MGHEVGIAIVGGGCSGTLVAAQLLRNGYAGSLAVIEPRPQLGRGLAYSTRMQEHLLNVPAGKMSAYPDQPSHFLDWLRCRRCPDTPAGAFVPRRDYGEYLEELLHHEIDRSASFADIRHIFSEVTAITSASDHAELTLGDGSHLRAGRVVLAIGNPASSPHVDLDRSESAQGIDHSPWMGDTLRLRFAGERILLLGSGLSAIDSMLTLLGQGDASQVWMVSRRGMMPQTHSPCRPTPTLPPLPASRSVRSILREVRERIEMVVAMGFCWRVAIDAVRPVSNQIWSELPLLERQRFLRHLRPYWEPHRHRKAPAIEEKIQQHLAAGRLHVISGRVRKIDTRSHSIRTTIQQHSMKQLHVTCDRVINCTGIHENYNNSPRPLIRQLIASGLASANDLGSGFETDEHGALVGIDGAPSQRLFTLGPPRRGGLFETTAVPEIRHQAEALAHRLLKLHQVRSLTQRRRRDVRLQPTLTA
jgi:uncharacterized NAD(P)/FAD-binding protein YdhS